MDRREVCLGISFDEPRTRSVVSTSMSNARQPMWEEEAHHRAFLV